MTSKICFFSKFFHSTFSTTVSDHNDIPNRLSDGRVRFVSSSRTYYHYKLHFYDYNNYLTICQSSDAIYGYLTTLFLLSSL